MNLTKQKSTTDLRQEAERLTAQAAEQEARQAAEQERIERAAFVAKQAQHSAEQSQALQDFSDTERAIVATVQELSELLEALTERRKQAAAVGVAAPHSYVDRLGAACKATQESWKLFRPALVGAPPPEDPRESALREARAEVKRCQSQLATWQSRLASTPGSATSDVAREALRRCTDWSEALQLSRTRLAKALAAMPNQTAAIRRERLANADAQAERQTVTVPV